MGIIAEAHGEAAGLSNDDLTVEGFATQGNAEILPSGAMTFASRKDFRNNGGDFYFGQNGAGSANPILNLDRLAEEGFIRLPFIRPASITSNDVLSISGLGTSATNPHWTMEVPVSGDTELYQDGALQVTSAGNIPKADDTFPVLELWWRISTLGNSDGHLIVYKDFDYSTPWVEYTGDVYETGFGGDRDTNQIRFYFGRNTGADDVKVQDITIEYDTGSGDSITPGTVLEVEDSGATTIGFAIVTQNLGDSVAGKLQLREIVDASGGTHATGVAWDGLIANSPLSGAVTLTAGAFSATATNGDIDPDSGFCGEGYYAPGRVPETLNGTDSSPLTVFGGADAIDSLEDGVDSSSETEYVYTETSGENDIYDFGTVLPAAVDVASVLGTTLYSRMRKDGVGIDNYVIQTKEGANSIVEEDPLGLAASFEVEITRMRLNPRTSTEWTHTTLSDTEFGVKFES